MNVWINANERLHILTIAIAIIQTQSHTGIQRKGSILIKQTNINRKSATVSSFAPNGLAVPVFLAIVPSIISVQPQKR